MPHGTHFFPSSEHAKMIWVAHYSQFTRHFRVEKAVLALQKYFYYQTFDRMLGSTSKTTLLASFPNQQSRSKAYILLFQLLVNLGNPSRWITCQAFLLLSMEMTSFSWSSTDFLRWPLWRLARIVSQQKPLLISYLNECGYTLGSHSPLSQIRTIGS